MRILNFNYEYPPLGGGGGVVHELIVEQLATRHRVVVVTSAFRDLPRREVRSGVEIVRVPVIHRHDRAVASLTSMLSFPPAAWHQAWRTLRVESFDLIHSHFAVPTGVGSLPVARAARIPHVLSVHGGDLYDPSKRLSPHRLPLVRSVVRSVLRRSDAVVAQSENTLQNAREYYSHEGPVEIIPLGIKQPSFPKASRAELGLPSEGFLAVTVGRLLRRKRLDQLLRVIAAPECAQIRLVVVGEGPQRAELEQFAGSLGVRDRVCFTDRVDEVRKWQILDVADAYVSTTAHEGFGLVFLEAMTVGLPIVTFDHGGHTDFLTNDENGYVVAVGEVEALAQALAKLRADPEVASRFRRNNLAQAPSHDVEHCAREYETLFESLVGRSSGQPSTPSSAPQNAQSLSSGSDARPLRPASPSRRR